MSKYAEPWKLRRIWFGEVRGVPGIIHVVDVRGDSVGQICEHAGKVYASRIILAINACAHLTDAELETMIRTHGAEAKI